MGPRLSPRRTRRLSLGLFVLAVWTSPGQAQEKAPWARIVIIGASVSHGFTASEPFGGLRPARDAFVIQQFKIAHF